MVLPNRNINAICKVILHIACRYPHLYEQLQDKQGEKSLPSIILFLLTKSVKLLRPKDYCVIFKKREEKRRNILNCTAGLEGGFSDDRRWS